MTKAMIFLSTRQLTQVDFSMPLFNSYDLIVIASAQELDKLPSHIAAVFSRQFPVSITANDGVIVEYDNQEIAHVVGLIQASYPDIDFICFDEGNVELTHALRHNSFNDSELERFRDKVTMKKWLSAQHITTPRFLETLDDEQGCAEGERWCLSHGNIRAAE